METIAQLERAENERIAKEKQEEIVSQKKLDIYCACILNKGADVYMYLRTIKVAV